MYEGMLAETVRIRGHEGEEINAYSARPLGPGPFPGVVVIHHMPGWDEWCKEVARKFAYHGYAAVLPDLHYRERPSPETSHDEVSAAVRAAGGVPDDRCIGDVEGAVSYLQSLPTHNGKVGVIGFCSGGRQTYLVACNIADFDAAVDCWGGGVTAKPEDLTPANPVAPVDMTPNLAGPLLGLFGNEDQRPSPQDVNDTEEALKQAGKTYEFHRYDGAGHGFFATDRPGYRQHAAVDGWDKVLAWYAKYLQAPVAEAVGAGS